MSEDTEKPLTAVEIEQKLKQERQLQIDQSSENKESTPASGELENHYLTESLVFGKMKIYIIYNIGYKVQ